jgi:hypothetical protein
VFPSDDEESKPEDNLDRQLCKTFQGGRGTCLPITSCSSMKHERNLIILRRSLCGFDGVTPKLCCPFNKEKENGGNDPLDPSPSNKVTKEPTQIKPHGEVTEPQINGNGEGESVEVDGGVSGNIGVNVTPRPQPVKTTSKKPNGNLKQEDIKLRVPDKLHSSK